KVAGALNLVGAAVNLGLKLDFLALFSSASVLLGLAGGPDYAAANSCLDGLACHINRRVGLGKAREFAPEFRAVSIQYGPWTEAGTAVENDLVQTMRSAGHIGV
ncbi:unnamed protein product, partial [Discosporangium mesarthrocarpum]